MISLHTEKSFLEYPSLQLWKAGEKYNLDFKYGGMDIHINFSPSTQMGEVSWIENRAVTHTRRTTKTVSVSYDAHTPQLLQRGLGEFREWYGARIARLLHHIFKKKHLDLTLYTRSWQHENLMVFEGTFKCNRITDGQLLVVYDLNSGLMKAEVCNYSQHLLVNETQETTLSDLDFYAFFGEVANQICTQKHRFPDPI